MGVEFDLDSDGRFRTSLQDLDKDTAAHVVKWLAQIQMDKLSWEDFVSLYRWERLVLEGSDTYPGANEFHTFFIKGQKDEQVIEVIGYTFNSQLVVSAVARINTK